MKVNVLNYSCNQIQKTAFCFRVIFQQSFIIVMIILIHIKPMIRLSRILQNNSIFKIIYRISNRVNLIEYSNRLFNKVIQQKTV